MSWSRLFHLLYRADWSIRDIAEAYGTSQDRVATLLYVEAQQ